MCLEFIIRMKEGVWSRSLEPCISKQQPSIHISIYFSICPFISSICSSAAKEPSQGQFWPKCKRLPLDKHAPVICSASSFDPDIQFLWHSQMLRYLARIQRHMANLWLHTAEDVVDAGNGWMATLHYSCNVKEANKLITLSAKHAMKCLNSLNSLWTFADCCVICIWIVCKTV